MKKLLSLLLAAALLTTALSACKKVKPEPEEPSSSVPAPIYLYQDGDYKVTYAVAASDRTLDYLTLSVKNDLLTVTEYSCKEDDSAPATSSGEAASQASSGKPASSESAASRTSSANTASAASEGATEYEAEAREQMAKILEEYEAAGKDVEQMELVEGTDEHFYRFQRMIRTALEFAKAGDSTPVILGKYADGSYESVLPAYNPAGWKEFVKLTVKDGLIDSITFDATKLDDDTALLTADAELNKAGATDTPASYYPAIATGFVEGGEHLDSLVVPKNGSLAATSFEKLMNPLLATMISGGKTSVVAPMYFDGTYKAQFKDFDKYGWKDYVVLEIKNDLITVKEFDAVSKADEKKLKSMDTATAEKWTAAVGQTPDELMKELFLHFEESHNDVTGVDNVAGATVSVNNFKLLTGQILATAAVAGDTEATLDVTRIEVK